MRFKDTSLQPLISSEHPITSGHLKDTKKLWNGKLSSKWSRVNAQMRTSFSSPTFSSMPLIDRDCADKACSGRGTNSLLMLSASADLVLILLPLVKITITWILSGFSGYIWLDTKIVLKKKKIFLFYYIYYFHCLYPKLSIAYGLISLILEGYPLAEETDGKGL